MDALIPMSARVIVISPHLDDGVLSCGDLLGSHPGSVVVTALAGRPPAYPALTSWDERGGFGAGADVVAARRAEDARALAVLGGRPAWLDFPDPQYGPRPTRQALADALLAALDEAAPDVAVLPLGIFHDDHILTSDAALDVLARRPSWAWLVYADAIYRAVPDLVARRLEILGRLGFAVRDAGGSSGPATERKRRAVACYASQVRALERSWEGGVADVFEAERYWQIGPAEAATAAPRSSGEGLHDGDDR